MNSVSILGRLTSNPELRRTQSGISVTRFTIAVNRPFKNKQTGEFEADFIPCIAWRNTAEFITRYFTKGKMIAVTGALQTGSYQGKNHPDVTHYTTDVLVDTAFFCGDKSDSGAGNQNYQQQPQNVVQQAQQAGIQTAQEPFYGNLSDFEEILSDGDVPF